MFCVYYMFNWEHSKIRYTPFNSNIHRDFSIVELFIGADKMKQSLSHSCAEHRPMLEIGVEPGGHLVLVLWGLTRWGLLRG